jgi:hypothetical protein
MRCDPNWIKRKKSFKLMELFIVNKVKTDFFCSDIGGSSYPPMLQSSMSPGGKVFLKHFQVILTIITVITSSTLPPTSVLFLKRFCLQFPQTLVGVGLQQCLSFFRLNYFVYSVQLRDNISHNFFPRSFPCQHKMFIVIFDLVFRHLIQSRNGKC